MARPFLKMALHTLANRSANSLSLTSKTTTLGDITPQRARRTLITKMMRRSPKPRYTLTGSPSTWLLDIPMMLMTYFFIGE